MSKQIGDLGDDEIVGITCSTCETSIELSGERLKQLNQPYRTVNNFADAHICGQCHKLGAILMLKSGQN